MLECIAIKLCVVVEVIRVCKKIVACAEYIATAHIWAWQSYLFWAYNFEAVFGLTIEGFTHFVTKISIGVFIADNLYCICDACCSMVSGKYNLVA